MTGLLTLWPSACCPNDSMRVFRIRLYVLLPLSHMSIAEAALVAQDIQNRNTSS